MELLWLLLVLLIIAAVLGYTLRVKLKARDEAAERQRRWDAYMLMIETQPSITADKIEAGDITAGNIRARAIEIRADNEQS